MKKIGSKMGKGLMSWVITHAYLGQGPLHLRKPSLKVESDDNLGEVVSCLLCRLYPP